jgi:hypothetical protein
VKLKSKKIINLIKAYIIGVLLILLHYAFDYFPLLRRLTNDSNTIGGGWRSEQIWWVLNIVKVVSFFSGVAFILMLTLALIYKKLATSKSTSIEGNNN